MKATIRATTSSLLKKNTCCSIKQCFKSSSQSFIASGLLSSVRNFSSSARVCEEFDQQTMNTSLVGADLANNGTTVYERIGKQPFSEEIAQILMAPLPDQDIEVKPDGILYLPEIKYRRILNKAFGPGGWCLVPLSEFKIERGSILQEYGLFCRGQFVSQSFGEQTVDEQGYKSIGSSLEGAKSNALMRCCKDIGIGSELWDPNFIIAWRAKNVVEAFCEHVTKKTTKKLFRRHDREFTYPYVEKSKFTAPKKQAEAVVEQVPQDVEEQVEADEEPVVMMTPDSVDSEASLFDNFGMDDGSAQYKKEPTSRKKETSEDGASKGFKFDSEGIFPFGKFKGQKVKDIINTPKFKGYVKFMEENNVQPAFLSQLKAYMTKNNL